MNNDFIYDIEVYPNLFSCCTVHKPTGTRFIHEVSDRRNQSRDFSNFIYWINTFPNARMVGFNNEAFDYPIIHRLVKQGKFSAMDAYLICDKIITGSRDDAFSLIIWPNDRIVPQVDLYKIHHFDNPARATSLKALEIAMNSWNVKDLPYKPGSYLETHQLDEVIEYMCHDVARTSDFYDHSLEKMKFREKVSRMYGFDATNFNDTKIGKEFFTSKLEQASPGITGTRSKPKRLRQTHRSQIVLNDIILPWIEFNDPEFNRILTFMKGSVVTHTKGFFSNLKCEVKGFEFCFGLGGIHGSVKKQHFHSDDDYELIDIDVASYYPSISPAFGFYPAHLSNLFCDLNKELFKERVEVGKKTDAGETIKLGLNGTYGDSNSVFSCFYDPQYTMAITVNGQLLLCMLAEKLMTLEGVNLIQINTDGMTARVPKYQKENFHAICKDWERATTLVLESVNYKSMFVRDVNNYIGVYNDGKVKLKGAYEHNVPWHKNHSSKVVAKAVEAYLVRGECYHDFIMNHSDAFDFCRTAKVPRSSRLETTSGIVVQRISRYYIALHGEGLVKVMPPLAKKMEAGERYIGIDVGYKTALCNNMSDFNWSNLNRLWYVDQAKKLIEGVGC